MARCTSAQRSMNMAQRIARQRVIIAAGVHILELAGLVIVPLRILAIEQEAFDFVGGIQRVAVLLVQALRVAFEHAADVGAVGLAVFIDDLAEHQHLAGAEDVGWAPNRRRSNPCAAADRFRAAR